MNTSGNRIPGSSARLAASGIALLTLVAGCATVPAQVPGQARVADPATTSASAAAPAAPPTPTRTPAPVDTPTSTTPPVRLADPPSSSTRPATSPDTPAPPSFPAALVRSWIKDQDEPNRRVFLTFDDGPNEDVTPRILDILKREQVHATFFVLGSQIENAPDVIRRIVAEGHSIGLHSFTHDYKRLYPSRSADAMRIIDEAKKSIAALRVVLGDDFTTSTWRYPGGHMSWKGMARADDALHNLGLDWIDWNVLTGDAEPKSRRPTTTAQMVAMATAAITQKLPVAVVLAHDSVGKELTVESLPQIIAAYKKATYEFATIAG